MSIDPEPQSRQVLQPSVSPSSWLLAYMTGKMLVPRGVLTDHATQLRSDFGIVLAQVRGAAGNSHWAARQSDRSTWIDNRTTKLFMFDRDGKTSLDEMRVLHGLIW